MMVEEKRKFPRVALKIEDGYFASFKLANDEKLVGPIINFSAGGLNLEAPANAADKIKAGDRLFLINIAGGTTLAFVSQIEAEIRWINPSEDPAYLSVGMEFIDISQAVREQMIKFVHSERMSRGQYD
jgi:c-di-GMP-binding flagellar brake protein YcgR